MGIPLCRLHHINDGNRFWLRPLNNLNLKGGEENERQKEFVLGGTRDSISCCHNPTQGKLIPKGGNTHVHVYE